MILFIQRQRLGENKGRSKERRKKGTEKDKGADFPHFVFLLNGMQSW
jgi:hypothetical protein